MIKTLSVTNNGSVIVLSRNHYIAVYDHRFGQCIFREATDFSDAHYVSGNLLLLAARSGGITWFDTESLKTGQINGINSRGIKGFLWIKGAHRWQFILTIGLVMSLILFLPSYPKQRYI